MSQSISSRLASSRSFDKTQRDISKQKIIDNLINKSAREKCLRDILENFKNNKADYDCYIAFVNTKTLNADDFLTVIENGQACVDVLTPKFSKLVEAILSLDWLRQSDDNRTKYKKFLIDVLTAHSKFVQFAIKKLVSHWLPTEADELLWQNGIPNENLKQTLGNVHDTIACILEIIPLTSDKIKWAIDSTFPYFTKASHIFSGYVYNIFWLLQYRPTFSDELLDFLLRKLIELDTNASKSYIHAVERNDECDDSIMREYGKDEMKYRNAETLDLCMEQLFSYIENEYNSDASRRRKLLVLLKKIFLDLILPTYNSHHVQFIIFYYCSLNPDELLNPFIQLCWSKVNNMNESPLIRRTAVCYIASFVCQAKFVSIKFIQQTLQYLCDWAMDYIDNTHTLSSINIMKAHLLFYSVCHSIFHIIAIRIEHLTSTRKDLEFLESLQLSAIVKSSFNPLRVCNSDTATIFASVTKKYQLVYCQTILERNARQRLAMVYSNEIAMPDQTLDVINPFDAYILKKSGKRITPFYLQYLPNDDVVEETDKPDDTVDRKRLRLESLTSDEYFIDTKKVMMDISRSLEKDVHC